MPISDEKLDVARELIDSFDDNIIKDNEISKIIKLIESYNDDNDQDKLLKLEEQVKIILIIKN